jgi:hypothetical protein
VIENRRVRGESCDGEVAQIALQRPACQQSARDVVKPQALTEFVKVRGSIHGDLSSV